MKSLTQYMYESLYKHYKVEDLDIEKFKEAANKVAKESFGASVAELKFKLVDEIVEKMNGERNVSVSAKNYIKGVPYYGDDIEKILNELFHFVKSKEGNIYLAPKKRTSVAAVKRWLGDDFAGTMENPMY